MEKELARGFATQIGADSVTAPTLVYGEELTALYFVPADLEHGRVTFEGLDSLRVCRGEYDPYPSDWHEGQPFHWVSTVENSAWLRERYLYEKLHYERAYEFGGNVEEMLTEYRHFLFQFHDEYVEALARGIWIESSHEPFSADVDEAHPLRELPEKLIDSSFVIHRIRCQVRRNELDPSVLMERARYCSQRLASFALELEGRVSVDWSLLLRNFGGPLRSVLKGSMGKTAAVFDGVASIEDARPYVESWMSEVRARRDEMGKKDENVM
ncbi:MAG: hypothetical protein AAFQ65_15250 [Myxococcota bacterium]